MQALLADESIPYDAVKACRRADIDVLSVIELATGATDQRVLELTRTQNRILVTLDAEMGGVALRSGAEASAGAVLLRLRPGGAKAFAELMRRLLESGPALEGMYTLLYGDRIRQFPLAGFPPPAEPAG